MSDEVVWQVINQQFCSFKFKYARAHSHTHQHTRALLSRCLTIVS